MTYIPEEYKVLYRSKDGEKKKIFDALEWLAAMCSHVPNKGEQMVRMFIEDEEVIKKILKHLGLWDVKLRAPPKVTAPFVGIHQDYSDSQLPPLRGLPLQRPRLSHRGLCLIIALVAELESNGRVPPN
jgi:hypothetical protein